MEQSEKERIKEIKKQASYDRKARRAIRRNRFRALKNFIWWLSGVVSSFVLVAAIAFIAVGVVPIGNYFGENKDEMVSENVSSKTALDIFKTIDQYKISDFKILQTAVDELITNGGIDEFVTIDKEKLGELQFVYSEESGKTIGSEIQNCIRVSKKLFGDDIVKMGIFDHSEVPEDEVPTTAADFNPKLYYYVSEGSAAEGTAVYSRAYGDDKNRLAESEGKTLYYVALDYVPFGEMKDLIGERIGVLKWTDVLTAFGNDMTDSTIAEVLGDTKVNSIATFDINSVKLNVLLPDTDESGNSVNKELYDFLCDAVKPTENREEQTVTVENLTIGDLTGETGTFSMDNVSLKTYLGEENAANATFYAVLRDLAKVENNDDIKMSTLKNANTNDIHLITVLKNDLSNAKLYSILQDLVGETAEEITIGDLTGLDTDDLHLTCVIEETAATEQLYDIVREATGKTVNSDITLSSLSSFDIGNVKFSTAMRKVNLADNKILSALMSDGEFTINELGDKVNELELSVLFDVECFTVDSAKANVNVKDGNKVLPATYKKVVRTNKTTGESEDCYMLPAAALYYAFLNDDTYEYDYDSDGPDYYISTESQMLLFLFYDYDYGNDGDMTNNHDANGNALIYLPLNPKIGQLQSDWDGVSSNLMDAKIRQLADSGVLDDNGEAGYKDALYKISVREALNMLENALSA